MRPGKTKQVMCELAPQGPEDSQAKGTACANYEWPSLILMDHLEKLK